MWWFIQEDFPCSSDGKESACNAGALGSIPGSGRFSGEGVAIHSSILAWRVPRTEEPGGPQFMGLQTVEHDWVINTAAAIQEEVYREMSHQLIQLLTVLCSYSFSEPVEADLHFPNFHLMNTAAPEKSGRGKSDNTQFMIDILVVTVIDTCPKFKIFKLLGLSSDPGSISLKNAIWSVHGFGLKPYEHALFLSYWCLTHFPYIILICGKIIQAVTKAKLQCSLPHGRHQLEKLIFC